MKTKKPIYLKLAKDNLIKNKKIYYPFFISATAIIMMFYLMIALANNGGLSKAYGGTYMQEILGMGTGVVGFFSIIFLFYTNSFLMKQRKKELGLFAILGLEKKHISRVMLYETCFIAFASITAGILFGLLFGKLLFLITLNILQSPTSIAFEISIKPVITTLILFVGVFILVLLQNLWAVYKTKPIELLKGDQLGEKEPKTKWIMTILGVLMLCTGYGISITITDPYQAFFMFFVAVILIIIGTYFIFIAGSIALLKMLRKNKAYYYKTENFISLSSMMYRMKQNAVGLANICILSTMVLVMTGSTISLYMGINDMVESDAYVRSFSAQIKNPSQEGIKALKKTTEEAMKKYNTNQKDILELNIVLATLSVSEDGTLKFSDADTMAYLLEEKDGVYFMTQKQFMDITHEPIHLNENEIRIYGKKLSNKTSIKLFGEEYMVQEANQDTNETLGRYLSYSHLPIIVVKDEDVRKKIVQQMQVHDGVKFYMNEYLYAFNLSDESVGFDVYTDILKVFANTDESKACLLSKANDKLQILAIFGGMFFLGLFLGILFILATALIIYYKQISEGYDDQQRFQILKKVGMGHNEIKKIIRKQVLLVFFLPLAISGIHVMFAFPAITRMLSLLQMHKIGLFALCVLGCFIIFSIIYAVIYLVTSKIYYSIVNANNM